MRDIVARAPQDEQGERRFSSRRRALAKQGKLVLPAAEMVDEPVTFAPIVLCEPEPPQSPEPSPQPDDKLRLIFGDVAIELAADTPAARIAEIVHALGASS